MEIDKIIHFFQGFFSTFLENGIDTIGFSGPTLLLLSTIYLVSNKKTFISIYLVGFVFNIILNFFAKGLIQQPRPTENKRLFNLEILKGDRISYDRYGMPSGHTQSVFYSTIFVYLVLRNKSVTTIYLLVSCMTLYQRIKYEDHTILQVIIGSLTGAFMGYLVYHYGKSLLKGILLSKPDDNAPI